MLKETLDKYPDLDIDIYQLNNDDEKITTWLERCSLEMEWVSGLIKIFGKEHKIPRLQSWYADKNINYAYSGKNLARNDWNEILNEIKKDIDRMKSKKEEAQPTKIKTSGSTFKNPINQTKKKVWELIKESVPLDTKFGDAIISDKHCNFFVNDGKAKSSEIELLINKVKKKVQSKTGINLELEIKIIGNEK